MNSSTARFVRQPDGLYARFSTVSVDITHLNLSEQEAEEVAKRFNMAPNAVTRARLELDDETWSDVLQRVENEQGHGRCVDIQNQIRQGGAAAPPGAV